MIVIYDLDGTLIDSAPDIHAGGEAVLRQEGLPTVTFAQSKSFIGDGAGKFIERLIGAAEAAPDPDRFDRMLNRFLALYETAHDRTTLYPGALSAMTLMAAHGVRFGLCTNKPEAATRAVLDHFDITGRFEVIVGGDTLPQRKPDPAPLLHVIDAMGGGPVVYVGDSEVDAATAQEARVPFALFTEGYRRSPIPDISHQQSFQHHDRLPAVVAGLLRGA